MSIRKPDEHKETATEEPDDFDRLIAELRQQGILVGGEGPRESLRPIAHIPGFLERFMERRG